MTSTVKDLKTLIYFYSIKKYIIKHEDMESGTAYLIPTEPVHKLKEKAGRRLRICKYIIETLYQRAENHGNGEELPV